MAFGNVGNVGNDDARSADIDSDTVPADEPSPTRWPTPTIERWCIALLLAASIIGLAATRQPVYPDTGTNMMWAGASVTIVAAVVAASTQLRLWVTVASVLAALAATGFAAHGQQQYVAEQHRVERFVDTFGD